MEQGTREQVLMGLQRIAFGDVRDPVRLLFCEEPTVRELNSMDLFNVSEIKRLKGGGMEIKFFDRIRALQCMQALGEESGSAAELYRALEEGARGLREEGR